MKYIIINFLLFITIVANGQELARVNKVMNKYVFWYNEPVQPYETVFTFQSSYNATPCPVLSNIISQVMDCAIKESGMQSRFFDAIIIEAGARDVAIKFKSDTTDNAVARIKKTNGMYAFIYSEPISSYDFVDNIKVFAVQGLSQICLTPNQRAEKVISESQKYCKKKKVEFDAIILGDDAIHNIIKFN